MLAEDDRCALLDSRCAGAAAEDSSAFQNRFTPEELLEMGFVEERFRVDRKKLEEMIRAQQCALPSNDIAEDFFQRVMTETSTQVSWPSKLKIGAKSKKDPHVKIVGKPEDVEAAKQMILQVLDTKQKNRVTLKMDVSHSDHSYIIGKGGFKIQQVMEETGCHIHFPDSNRNSNAEKSNQVSIAGEAHGVENARNKIRDLLPLVYMFELPNGIILNPGDENGPVLQHIQQTYSFTLAFKSVTLGKVLIMVRGCHRLLPRLRHGLIVLMEFLTGTRTVPAVGVMKTEIAVQHHAFVMGVNGINVQMIMNKTGATITFPDPSAPNSTLPVSAGGQLMGPAVLQSGPHVLQTKTSVIIRGSFDSVCAAWDELLKSLPLALMFDLKEGQDVDPMLINRLMEENNINIMVRPKIRENIKSVVIRGTEKDSKILFETRKEILGIQECARPLAACPSFYADGQRRRRNSAPDEAAGVSGHDSNAEPLVMLKNLMQENPNLLGLLRKLSSAVPAAQDAGQERGQYADYGGRYNAVPEHRGAWSKAYDYKMKNGYYLRNFQDVPPFLPPPINQVLSSPGSEDCDSGYYSSKSRNYNGSSSQPGSSASSTTSSVCNESLDAAGNRRFLQARNFAESDPAQELIADYENKKITATKAMYEDIVDGVRTPTTLWSGYGFSKSMPECVMKGKMPTYGNTFDDVDAKYQQHTSSASDSSSEYHSPLAASGGEPEAARLASPAARSPFSLSNFWETLTPVPTPIGLNSFRDLQQLLNYFDLEKYLDLFVQQEIDLAAFLMLTDCDLQQLNISYTARRRMLNAIAAMRESKMDFSLPQFKAAPGAERKPLFSRMSSSDA